jgi:hypothetical protein
VALCETNIVAILLSILEVDIMVSRKIKMGDMPLYLPDP